uniref:Fletcherin n=1 Tax=Limnodynastes fletcheri TaxID=39403 RepID=FLET_LIMFT|nr:RecName: Full=Fletcherin [Limnodynastes fletcheri]prf//1923189E fletcherin [Limnodynastes fletcheri]
AGPVSKLVSGIGL